MKKISLTLIIFLMAILAYSQGKYLTKEGEINFYSHTALEDITADNKEVASIIDSETGEVIINVRMTAFHFKKRLMEEHFNENYVESEKYPKSTFKGKILNNNAVDYTKMGSYIVEVKGEMTIHGKTNTVNANATIEITDGGLVAKTKFLLNPEDYGIKIPKLVRKNIAENLEISVNMIYSQI